MAEKQQGIGKKEAEIPEKAERTKSAKVYNPAVDIIERKEDIVVTADMPGVDEQSIDITLEKNILTIYGRVEPKIQEGHRLTVKEFGVGDYERTFILSDEIDRDRIQAAVRNGILNLVLPKADVVKTRRIAVKAEA